MAATGLPPSFSVHKKGRRAGLIPALILAFSAAAAIMAPFSARAGYNDGVIKRNIGAAAGDGDVERLDAILKRGIPPEIVNQGVLCTAVVKRQAGSVAVLFKHKADPNIESGICFVMAADEGNIEIVQQFIAQPEFNPYTKEIDSFLKYYESVRKESTFSESRFSTPVFQKIIGLIEDSRAAKKHLEAALRLEDEIKSSKLTDDSFLHAVSEENVDRVRESLKNGIDADIQDDEAICIAALRGNKVIFNMLVEAGADPTARNGMPMRLAAMRGHNHLIRDMVMTHKVNINGHKNDGRPLIAAVTNGYTDTVRMMVNELGANPNVLGGWPLAIALQNGEVESARLLLAAGADPDLEPVKEVMQEIAENSGKLSSPGIHQVSLMIHEARKNPVRRTSLIPVKDEQQFHLSRAAP